MMNISMIFMKYVIENDRIFEFKTGIIFFQFEINEENL